MRLIKKKDRLEHLGSKQAKAPQLPLAVAWDIFQGERRMHQAGNGAFEGSREVDRAKELMDEDGDSGPGA